MKEDIALSRVAIRFKSGTEENSVPLNFILRIILFTNAANMV